MVGYYFEWEDCGMCGGDHKNDCRVCNGKGMVTDEDGREVPCEKCEGTGRIECVWCGGTGHVKYEGPESPM